MLPAQRFQSYSRSENLGLTQLKGITSSEVYNTVVNKLAEVSEGLNDIVDSLTQKIVPPGIEEAIDDGVRAVKDVFTTIQDITKFDAKAIENEIAGMLPDNPAIQNTFRQITAQCRNKALSQTPGFKKFKDKLSCGSGSGACSSSQISGLLNKATGGLIDLVAKGINGILKAVMSLANMGYDAGLCKIFGALVNNLPGGVVQKAAAGLLGVVGGQGNVTAVLDISANMGRAIPSLEAKNLVGRITNNFKTPKLFYNNEGEMFDGMMDAYDGIDPGYDRDEYGMRTISALGGEFNEDFASSANSYLGRGFNTANLDSVGQYDNDDIASAYVGSKSSYSFDDESSFSFA